MSLYKAADFRAEVLEMRDILNSLKKTVVERGRFSSEVACNLKGFKNIKDAEDTFAELKMLHNLRKKPKNPFDPPEFTGKIIDIK